MKYDFTRQEWDFFISNCCFNDKEMEIIPFLQRGWYEEDIAAELYISRRTLCRRKKSIKTKILKVI